MKKVGLLLLFSFLAFSAYAEEAFEAWKKDLMQRAAAEKISVATINKYIPGMTYYPKVIELDRKQPEFSLPFGSYIKSRITASRVDKGREMFKEHNRLLGRIEVQYGVPAHYLVAFWGLETNYGGYKGTFDVVNSLATLAYDNRRPIFFTNQLMTLLKILDNDKVDAPEGSWAGAFGHFQFIPTTYAQYAVDGDGDGKRDIVNSFPDALASAANYLSKVGWNNDVTWGREVFVYPTFDTSKIEGKRTLKEWEQAGVLRKDGRKNSPVEETIPAELVLPAGLTGPAFLVYENFDVIKRWNRSDSYALAVGILADKIVGKKDTFDVETISEGKPLYNDDILKLQTFLQAKGFYEGKLDGQNGSKTRAALRAYQRAQGIPADGYISKETLEKILN